MFWIRLFWLEAVAVPAIFIYMAAQAPADAPYRGLNLVVWSVALAVGIGAYAFTRLRTRREARS